MNILVVDDDATTLRLLERSLTKWNHRTFTAGNGRQALEFAETKTVDLVVSDWLMPEMNGLELCARIRELSHKRYVYFILISAQDTRMDVVRGLEGGVDDYITKPVNLDELKARLDIGLRVLNLERELNQKYLAIKRNYYQMIHMFTQFLETYDRKLGGHSRRVGDLSLRLAVRHPDISPEDYPVVEASGQLHDVGLIGLPPVLLTCNITELPGDEKKQYWTHPERGEAILNQIDLLRPVARIVRLHHEQVNGRGFPDGVSGDDFPPTAEVVSAASIYDGLRYHRQVPLDKIAEQLQQMRGYQLSSAMVDLLIAINLEEIEAEAQRTEWKVEIEELEPGMVLAGDVYMRSGAFVMAANTCIDAPAIEKLRRYNELGNIGNGVFIKK